MHTKDEMPGLARPAFEANPEASELIGVTSTAQFFFPKNEGDAAVHARDTGGELVTVTREEAEAATEEVAEVAPEDVAPAPTSVPAEVPSVPTEVPAEAAAAPTVSTAPAESTPKAVKPSRKRDGKPVTVTPEAV